MDALLLAIGFKAQRTEEPKSADAPHNLYHPIDDDNRVDGDFGSITFRHSAYNTLGRHPALRRIVFGAVLGTAALYTAKAAAGDS